MNNQRSSLEGRRTLLALYGLILIVILALVGLTWANYRFSAQYPGGERFLVYWTATRSFLTEGQSPYSDAVTNRIQANATRWDISTGELNLQFLSPLYSGAIFLPFALIPDFTTARAVWMTALEVFLFLVAYMGLRLTRWKTHILVLVCYYVFCFFWFHSIYPLLTGSDAILVALLLTFVFLAIRSKLDELAGFLLALSTIELFLVAPLVIFIMVWAISRRRFKLVVWFWGSVVILAFGALFLLPSWPVQYAQAMLAHFKAFSLGTPRAAFAYWWPGIGNRLGWMLTALVCLVLVFEWWLASRKKEFRWFLWGACLTLALGQLAGLENSPANFVVLLTPAVVVFSVWEERWSGNGRITIVLSMIILGGIPWAIYLSLLNKGLPPQQMPVLLFPVPLFFIFTLYWVRWWAVRPQRLYVDALRDLDQA